MPWASGGHLYGPAFLTYLLALKELVYIMQRRTSRFPHAVTVLLGVIGLIALAGLVAGGRASASRPTAPPARGLFVATTSTLVINEVYDASTPSNEYFELYNGSLTATIDLTSYVIYNRDGSTPLSNLPSTVRIIGPQQYRVIGPAQLGTPTIAGSGLDTTDFLGLKNSASDTVVDVVNWGNAPNPNWPNFTLFQDSFFYADIPPMPAAGGPRSLSRYPNGYDTDTGLDWYSLPQSPGRANPSPIPTSGTATPTATVVGCEDRYEPDDTLLTAKILEQNTEQVHTLCRSAGAVKDRDWFVFPAVGGKLYTMLTKDLTGPVDTVITLYDAAGNALAENDDATPGQGLASRIDYTFGSGGTYYLQVRDKRSNGGLGYQYTVSLISTGALPPTGTSTVTPTINPNATSTPGVCYDAFEPDGVAETAKLLLIGTTQRHSICPTTDADWVRFYARAGKVYTIRTGNLGVGLDSYMYLFDSDGKTILAQNDDGGDGVASRIDFYPQRDDWYFVQVKNAGDIGGPDQTYELSLAVIPGSPQPPGTATSIIAPPVTGTPAFPTQPPAATKPPVPTPTQGAVQPTPTAKPTTLAPVPGPVGTGEPAAQPTNTPSSGVQGATGSAEQTATAEAAAIPGVPITGHPPVNANVSKPAQRPTNAPAVAGKPQQPADLRFAPMLFRFFYDADNSRVFGKGEGIRGLQVIFTNETADQAGAGQLVTSADGSGNLRLAVESHRMLIPYFGISMPLTQFPDRELHSLWLPPVKLPDRIP